MSRPLVAAIFALTATPALADIVSGRTPGRTSDDQTTCFLNILGLGYQFAAEMDDFAKCIMEDRKSKVSGKEGLRDLVVIEGIYDSIRKRRTIKL